TVCINGSRRARRRKLIFRHNDAAHLDRLLRQAAPDRPKLVAFESIYSMDGDIAPLADLLHVCEGDGALSYLDEVHAVGLYGLHGAGIAERDRVAARGNVIEGTLGKDEGLMM